MQVTSRVYVLKNSKLKKEFYGSYLDNIVAEGTISELNYI